MNENTQKIISLYNGERSSKEIAQLVGLSPRYVRRVAKKHNLERLHCGAQDGHNNHRYVCGRRVDLDGYVIVTAPRNHPYARKRPYRDSWIIYEHRLVMEHKLGRYFIPEEVVDHIDGLTLHNEPSNLRLFQKNGDHLRETITGLPKLISASGRLNIRAKHLPDVTLTPVDIYRQRRERGDVKLRQILLAALQFGIESPYLLGTHRYLMQKEIPWAFRSNLEQAFEELQERWEQDLLM